MSPRKWEFNVEWNGEQQAAILSKSGMDIKFKVDSNVMSINGAEKTIDVPARLIGSRVFVPLRVLVEGMGKAVFWDERGLVFIGSPNNTLDPEADKDIIDIIINY